MRRFAQFLLLKIALLGTMAQAAVGPTEAQKFHAWREQSAMLLMKHGDAGSLATAAALVFNPGSAAAVDAATRAAALAPQDPGIAWLRLRLCTETPNCDFRDAATVLRWVDAENAASWLPVLAAAERDKDKTEVDRIIADMAQGGRFDLYWNPLSVMMNDTLDAARKALPGSYAATPASRFAAVAQIAQAEIIPAFAPLADACRPAGGAERREACMRLSTIMQRGDTVAAQLAGFGIERRLLAPDSREAHAAAERRRLLEWRVSEAARFDASVLPWVRNTRVRTRLTLMRAKPREEDVCLAILREHKAALQPPDNQR